MSSNLAQLLTRTAAAHGDRPALKLDDAVVTYAMLDDGAARVAGLLKAKGLEPGDRVGIMLPNVPYFALAYYGVLRAGGVVVPMNVLLKAREVNFYLSDSGARYLFTWHEFLADAEPGAHEAGAEVIAVRPGEFERLLAEAPAEPEDVPRDGSDTAVILYTSGTTGTPKGAELTHSNMLENAHCSTELMRVSTEDVIFGALPLFHSFGQTCCLNNAVNNGACLTMLPRFDPVKALEIIPRDGVTIFEGVPTMYHALLNHPDREQHDVSSLRTCVSGGSALPVEVMRAFEEAFGCVIIEGYGLSETSPVASFNHLGRERKPGSIGTPIRGVEMKVVDDEGNEVARGEVGEIAIRGHNVMKGYWNRPDATEEVMQRRMVPHGRHGVGGRGRLFLHRRPQEGHDHPRRLQRVPARDRGGALRASCRARGSRHRSARRGAGRGGGRRGCPSPGERGRRRGHPRVRQGARGRLQVPPPHLVPRRAAQGGHRQGPQARDFGSRLRGADADLGPAHAGAEAACTLDDRWLPGLRPPHGGLRPRRVAGHGGLAIVAPGWATGLPSR